MATSDKPDAIVDFTNDASYTNKNGGKYKNGASYSTDKRIEGAGSYMRLKLSKIRASCRNLVLAVKVGRSFANRIMKEVDGTGLAPKTKCAIF
eukprot:1371244-Ditylum_brightwellii.AAC.1